MLWELVYNSIAYPGPAAPDALASLVAEARAKNERLGITGVLLQHRGEYVQLLEGERDVVQALYNDAILQDGRHRGVTLCWEQPIAVRSFSDWSMGLCSGDPLAGTLGTSDARELTRRLKALDLSGPGGEGRKVLLSIYASMRAAG
jgi:hypothetical protein